MPSKTRKRRKSMPWSGWAKISPKGRARTVMKRKCGKNAFWVPKKVFQFAQRVLVKLIKKDYMLHMLELDNGERNGLLTKVVLVLL